MTFNLAQTFYVDPNTVGGATAVNLTSLALFFKAKPDPIKTISGITYPGVEITICETVNDVPDLSTLYQNSKVRVEHPAINSGPTPDMPTVFSFANPISLSTGKKYAILINYDDPNFILWSAKVGDRVFGTNSPYSGVTNFTGGLFSHANDGTWTPISSTELKLKVNIASFTSNSVTVQIVDKNYEFFNVNNQAGQFVGGERVFVSGTPVTGNVSILAVNNYVFSNGAGNFSSTITVGDNIVINSGNTNLIRNVTYVNSSVLLVDSPLPLSNSQAMYYKSVVGTVYFTDPVANTLYLANSSANSTVYFTAANTVVGEISGASANIVSIQDLSVHQFLPELLAYLPPNGYMNLAYNFAYANGGGYGINNANQKNFINNQLETVYQYGAQLLSHSNEVRNANSLFTNGKSGIFYVTIGVKQNANGLYQSPALYSEKLDIFVSNNGINNDVTNENSPLGIGNAQCKHITTSVSFDQNKSAEGVFAYVTAYKPAGTDVKVYARLFNAKDSDSFDDKDWTLLASNSSSNTQVSSSISNSNYVDLVYNLPASPPTLFTANGQATVTSGNAQILGANTKFGTEIVVGDLIKVYSTISPQNYFVTSVVAVTNTTVLTMDTAYTNSSILGTGFNIDKLSTPHTAFVNPQNSNVCRYYNSNMAQYDTFDTMAFKIVLLSNTSYVAPRVAAFRAIGVTA